MALTTSLTPGNDDDEIIELTDIVEKGTVPVATGEEGASPLESQMADLINGPDTASDSLDDFDLDTLMNDPDQDDKASPAASLDSARSAPKTQNAKSSEDGELDFDALLNELTQSSAADASAPAPSDSSESFKAPAPSAKQREEAPLDALADRADTPDMDDMGDMDDVDALLRDLLPPDQPEGEDSDFSSGTQNASAAPQKNAQPAEQKAETKSERSVSQETHSDAEKSDEISAKSPAESPAASLDQYDDVDDADLADLLSSLDMTPAGAQAPLPTSAGISSGTSGDISGDILGGTSGASKKAMPPIADDADNDVDDLDALLDSIMNPQAEPVPQQAAANMEQPATADHDTIDDEDGTPEASTTSEVPDLPEVPEATGPLDHDLDDGALTDKREDEAFDVPANTLNENSEVDAPTSFKQEDRAEDGAEDMGDLDALLSSIALEEDEPSGALDILASTHDKAENLRGDNGTNNAAQDESGTKDDMDFDLDAFLADLDDDKSSSADAANDANAADAADATNDADAARSALASALSSTGMSVAPSAAESDALPDPQAQPSLPSTGQDQGEMPSNAGTTQTAEAAEKYEVDFSLEDFPLESDLGDPLIIGEADSSSEIGTAVLEGLERLAADIAVIQAQMLKPSVADASSVDLEPVWQQIARLHEDVQEVSERHAMSMATLEARISELEADLAEQAALNFSRSDESVPEAGAENTEALSQVHELLDGLSARLNTRLDTLEQAVALANTSTQNTSKDVLDDLQKRMATLEALQNAALDEREHGAAAQTDFAQDLSVLVDRVDALEARHSAANAESGLAGRVEALESNVEKAATEAAARVIREEIAALLADMAGEDD